MQDAIVAATQVSLPEFFIEALQKLVSKNFKPSVSECFDALKDALAEGKGTAAIVQTVTVQLFQQVKDEWDGLKAQARRPAA